MTDPLEAYWNRVYSSKRLAFLTGASECPRYGVISSYINYYAKRGKILDIGCGEGILLQHLHPNLIAQYTGVDVSSTVLESARRASEATFVRASAEEFESAQKFDAIILNEILYLMQEPTNQLVKYFRMLEINGVVIISMYDHKDIPDAARAATLVEEIWGEAKKLPVIVLDEARVTNLRQGVTWTIVAARPSDIEQS
jgi:2-polyprenyl-3-methyl-5-hydroxy-6-metoxy-1,4-benzoquinol methylase